MRMKERRERKEVGKLISLGKTIGKRWQRRESICGWAKEEREREREREREDGCNLWSTGGIIYDDDVWCMYHKLLLYERQLEQRMGRMLITSASVCIWSLVVVCDYCLCICCHWFVKQEVSSALLFMWIIEKERESEKFHRSLGAKLKIKLVQTVKRNTVSD